MSLVSGLISLHLYTSSILCIQQFFFEMNSHYNSDFLIHTKDFLLQKINYIAIQILLW